MRPLIAVGVEEMKRGRTTRRSTLAAGTALALAFGLAGRAGAQATPPAAGEGEAEPVGSEAAVGFAAVRRWPLKPGVDYDAFARLVREGYVPLIQRIAGFRAYYFGRAGETHVAIAVFEDEAGAVASTEAARTWADANVGRYVDVTRADVSDVDLWIEVVGDRVEAKV